MSRAAAPPSRTYWCESRMPRLPPVDKFPQTRLRAAFAPGVGNSVVTFDQSHSNSSATSCARPVSVPCPISERAIRMMTVSSGRMTTQAFTSGEPSWARTTLAPNGILRPSARPAPAAALPMTKERRLSFGVLVIMAGPLCLRRGVDGLTHLLEGSTPTDVGDPRVDIGIGRLRLFFQKRRHRHDHARLTVAALWHLVVEPGLLHLAQGRTVGEAFDGGDLLAFGGGNGHHAGADRSAVEVHRTGAALGDAAAVLGAGETDLLADRPEQGRIGIDADFLGLAVDRQARHRLPSRDYGAGNIRLRAREGKPLECAG